MHCIALSRIKIPRGRILGRCKVFDLIEIFLVFACGIVIGWCSFFFGIIPTDDEKEGE